MAARLPERLLGSGGVGESGTATTASTVTTWPVDGTPIVEALLPTLRVTAPPPRLRSQGAAESFYTVDFTTYELIQVDATLRGESATTRVYVEDAQWGTRVTQSEVDVILDRFDQSTPAASIDPGTGIAGIVESVFGPPTDVDLDGKVHILVLDIRDGFSGSGSYVAGYYTSNDQSLISSGSNRRDLLYIDSDPAQPTGSEVQGTVAHEYQHLVHYRADSDEGSGSPFMNEGLSELASYLCGYGLRSHSAYLSRTDRALDRWVGDLADYARVSRWALYLYEQLGLSFVNAVFEDPANGVTGIERALSSSGSGRDFSAMLADWFVANTINDNGADPRYGYVAAGGTASSSATHSSPAATGDGVVERRATDMVRCLQAEDLSVLVEETAGQGLRARAVALFGSGGPPAAVIDLTPGEPWSVAQETGLPASPAELRLLLYTTGVFGAEYAYELGGATGGVAELGCDDGSAESLGVLEPAAYDRGLAVRFTPVPREAVVRRVRVYSGDATPFDLRAWDDSGPGGGPGIEVMTPLRVTPAAGEGWLEIDLTGSGLIASEGHLYVGLIAPGGGADQVSVGMDEEAPRAGRSWLFDAGSWTSFATAGLGDADLMIRIDVQSPALLATNLSIGMLQASGEGNVLDVFVQGAGAVNVASLGGTVVGNGSGETVGFAPSGSDPGLYVARDVSVAGEGSVTILVTGGGACEPAAVADTLRFEAAWVDPTGGGVGLGPTRLDIPTGGVGQAVLVTAQPGGVYPGGPGAATIPEQVTFGPLGTTLGAPATVRIMGESGRVARWEAGRWAPLATRADAGWLEAETVTLGSFTVLPGGSGGPPPFRVVALARNPIGVESQLGLELTGGVESARVRLVDVAGRVVSTLHDGPLGAGSHLLPLAMHGRPAGIYWVEGVAGPHRSLVRLTFVR